VRHSTRVGGHVGLHADRVLHNVHLQVSDKRFKFDSEGNKKAAQAYKESRSGAERAEDPAAPRSPGNEAVSATVEGALAGDVIRVETITVK